MEVTDHVKWNEKGKNSKQVSRFWLVSAKKRGWKAGSEIVSVNYSLSCVGRTSQEMLLFL